MRIVLFHPRGYQLDPAKRNISSLACIMPPAGLASIASVLRKAGHKVTITDAALFYRVTNKEWAARIIKMKPDMVGFSVTTPAFNDAYEICSLIKECAPDIKTVLGGVHASWGKEKLMGDFPAIDHIISGEGENAFRALAEGFTDYDSIYSRNGSEVIRGTQPILPCVLDELPFPAYDLLKGFPRDYLMPLFGYPRHPGANIISSRGCVYSCSYCDRSVFGKSFRWNSPEYTFQQILWLNREFGIRHINFYDDLFTLNRNRVEELCLRLSSSRLPVTFNCIVRIGHIDRDMIGLLKKGGCWMVSVGIESGDQKLLDEHKDGLTVEDIRHDIQVLHDCGLWVKGLFMMGLPGETEESIIKTREFALSLPLKDANLTAFTPFPGAPVSGRIEELGFFDNDWSKMDCQKFVFVPHEIGKKEILEYHYGEFFKCFYNRKFMRKHVYPKMLFQSPHSAYRLIRNASDFLKYRSRLTGDLTPEK